MTGWREMEVEWAETEPGHFTVNPLRPINKQPKSFTELFVEECERFIDEVKA